jgi:hypothetical protein
MSDHADDPKAGESTGTDKPARKSNISKVFRWGLGIVVAALAAFLTASVTGVLNMLAGWVFPQTPITVTVTPEPVCPSVFTSPVDKVQQDLDTALGGDPDATVQDLSPIDGDETILKITVQGTSEEKVALNDLAVVVDKRDKPTGFAVGQCGGSQLVHFYSTDLDQPRPSLVPDSGPPEEWVAPARPVFGINVTSSDTESFYVVASTQHCDCSWHLSLKWSDSKRSDTYEIKNDGKPFRTMAADGLPRYYTSLDKKILR